jgi:predicted dehydrogenase
LDIRALADINEAAARKLAEEFEIPKHGCVEELLENPEIEIVVNLTPPSLHTRINLKILEAGKNLYCEKPFAPTLSEAREVTKSADEKGLLLSAAPDTFLGSSLQTCRKLLDDGWIGKPLYATANMMSGGFEAWHPSPANYYKQGGGPLFDMGPYYFSALIALLGPVKEIAAFSGTGFPKRKIYSQPLYGQEMDVEVPTHYSSVIEFSGGVIANMNMSFDIWHSSLPMLEIYGTEGTLLLPDPNMFGGTPKIYRKEQTLDVIYNDSEDCAARKCKVFEIPEIYPRVKDYARGIGVMDLARALADRDSCRAGAAFVEHVTEAVEGMAKAAETKEVYMMDSCCERPRPIEAGTMLS